VAAYLTGGKKSSRGKSKKAVDKTGFDDLTQAVAFAGGGVSGKLPQIYKV
jgi:hypothetical protein